MIKESILKKTNLSPKVLFHNLCHLCVQKARTLILGNTVIHKETLVHLPV